MSDSTSTYRTAVLAMPCVGTSTVFGILDVMASVGRDWEMLHGDQPKPPVFEASLLSLDGQPYSDVNGRKVTPDGALHDFGQPDLIIVPDLHLDPNAPPPREFDEFAPWIVNAHENGAMIASVCSGSLLLAETGVLNGLDATSHWGYCDVIARRFPEIRLRRERILVPAGEGHRIITAGGASAWGDLMLYLIGRLAGEKEARKMAKVYLLQPHTEGQLHYASLVAGRQHNDAIVAEAQAWAVDNYASSAPVAAMAKHCRLTERSLLRRFKKATGQTPAEYIQTLRIEEAKQMLETSATPIDEIAEDVGYIETSSFRHAFRKRVGMSASSYRKKWSTSAPGAAT
ncbi:GlxA family transcriptional regulator [Yoonia sediminilitoris]|uniref:AraC family transcriptional regulator with amidase-like domain n=1 Tax=Yoonia sediminilitoris TaxID=1286148 RepID=A0A2T6K6T5_9RHOB|nr:helix-turn-helix domain-containing protein [Yoonia sediminilitoris]PUB10396.1 AraC family transcriptional regulator with amidase-like domain [Yoonia sediminilitoris]RCW89862.1 AraC family transcriptional regulator with amidase-like domain [Yoonia sediminilitoris]